MCVACLSLWSVCIPHVVCGRGDGLGRFSPRLSFASAYAVVGGRRVELKTLKLLFLEPRGKSRTRKGFHLRRFASAEQATKDTAQRTRSHRTPVVEKVCAGQMPFLARPIWINGHTDGLANGSKCSRVGQGELERRAFNCKDVGQARPSVFVLSRLFVLTV
ncbi:hypothetical protein B0T26DRAFT_672692 [Lasiosphaeria miniovina]|uniref:Secreted protein n=1 Tax=Lasiosphaeria miniovina TaxID=1954250 RepID=A0AA40B5J8_9PEZI|nr:uncharacterized protein B0T26DRAFT_672692 [Lasiosphaeria miniovina]KAK0728101.1 hypothetical protein B0T26DRAFT_672692 [Lasiosphaeria miniovina]